MFPLSNIGCSLTFGFVEAYSLVICKLSAIESDVKFQTYHLIGGLVNVAVYKRS